MKIYFAPEFARQVERSPQRTQNIVKLVASFFERNDRSKIFSNPRVVIERLQHRDLYSIRFEDVRILASLVSDIGGEYWIFAQID